MRDEAALRALLSRIDGRGYKAYKDIEGAWDLGWLTLIVDHAQGDPFAAPSRVRVRVEQAVAGFPPELFATRVRRVALEDYLTRAFARAIERVGTGRKGSGKSGLIAIERPGQKVIERTAFRVSAEAVEARFVVGLPAAGRRVLGRRCAQMLLEEVPEIARLACLHKSLPADEVLAHVLSVEDQEALRDQLPGRGLVAFVADGAVLPRRSGVDDRPMRPGGEVDPVPFRSPESLRVTLQTPNSGPVTGMGIPEGVTLIVGGGYHGKSTLLSALAHGVYNHIPGDGRERVVTIREAVSIRAEDGRAVTGVDISPFISNLPFGRDTRNFSTENASGSTSQAANIIEALEVGARALLIDEDTSATNFMIRDGRMQELVSKEHEPITPLIDRVRELYESMGVSVVIVAGGSGDYFDVANTVVMMQEYAPLDVTERAREVARRHPTGRRVETTEPVGGFRRRCPIPSSFDASKGRREKKIKARGTDSISFGRWEVDLSCVEQVVEEGQTRLVGELLHYASRRAFDGRRTLREALRLIEAQLDEEGLDSVLSEIRGDCSRPRLFEVAAAVNRLRTLRVRQVEEPVDDEA